jgi:hypothetical protein
MFSRSRSEIGTLISRPNQQTRMVLPFPPGDSGDSSSNPFHQGIILVKVPKAASSTMAAVVLRIANRNHCSMKFVHWVHRHAYKDYAQRDPTRSLVILSVRNPAEQVMSHLFWSDVTLRETPLGYVTDTWMMRRLNNFGTFLGTFRSGQGGFTTQFAALEEVPEFSAWSPETGDVVDPDQIVSRIQEIVDRYDFIAVVERMDESLVALALLLGLDVGDMLVTSSKVSAPANIEGTATNKDSSALSYVYHETKGKCVPMVERFAYPLVQEYLRSDEFRSQTYGESCLLQCYSWNINCCTLTPDDLVGAP